MKLGSLTGVEPWRADDTLPPGTYVMKIIAAEDDKSSNGHPQIVLDLEVVDGDWKGAEKRDWITVTESSLGRVVQVLQAFGYPIPEGEFELKVADLVGRAAEVVLREDTWVGKDGEARTGVKVKGYKPAGAHSDVSGDASGFKHPNGAGQTDTTPLPF